MAIRYHFDLYPRDDPKDGTRLVRFTKLQSAEYRGEANGTGAGRFSIRADTAEAQFIDPLGMQYVRVVEEDTDAVTESVRGGFFLDSGDFSVLDERGTRRLEFGGAGTLSILERAVMWSHAYLDISNFGDQDPFDDIWRLYAAGTGNELGAMLWRVITESKGFRVGTTPYTHKHPDGTTHTDIHDDDRLADALSAVTMDFDQNTDSNSVAWSQSSGDFTAQIGESVLGVAKRLMEMGLYVSLDPDTFVLSAYEPGTHRRDRTGGSWGSTVIRFQAPTDGTIATGNVKSDAKRKLQSYIKRTHVLVGAKDNYESSVATDPEGFLWEGFYRMEAEDTTEGDASLEAAGDQQLAARGDAGDTVRLRIKLESDPSNGKYVPFKDILLDDLVTLHTGTGQWDFNEQTFPVAALTVQLRAGGDWDAWVDLGSSYSASQNRQFQVTTTPAHNHPPNPELCRPNTLGTDTVIYGPLEWDGGTGVAHTVPIYPSGTGTWPTDAASVQQSGFVTGGYNGTGGYVLCGGAFGAGCNSPKLPATPGTTYRYSFYGWVNAAPQSFYVFFYNAADVELAQEEVAAVAPDNTWLPFTADVTAPANTAYMTFGVDTVVALTRMAYDHLTVTLPGAGSSINDGHPDLVGSATRAARCDHRHDVHRDRAPTVDDDWATAGYKLGTIWAQLDDLETPTEIVGVWMAVDVSEGAAVWLEWPGGGATGHGALDGLGDDDHPQYIKDSEFGAKGRILVGTGSGTFDDLPVGTDGHRLVADSAETMGVKWAPAGDGSPASPTVAGSDAATFSTANGTISTPAETSTGDLLILFAEQGNGFSSITAGWDVIGWTSAANVNGCLATKVAEAGDAAGGGSVTAAFGGAFNGELIIVAVTGWRKINGYAWRQNSSSATTITTSLYVASTEALPGGGSGNANVAQMMFAGEGDLALYFGAARLSSGTITPSRGSVIEQRTGDTNASSVLASETLAAGGPVRVTMTTSSSAQVAGAIIVSG